jgi:carbonic anhydrase
MTAIDRMVELNRSYLSDGSVGKQPTHHLAVLTCMDTRIDPQAALGLEPGVAHVIRNAGGLVTPDTLRSLAISQRALGTREIAVVMHTDCGLNGFDDAGFRAALAVESGRRPGWDVPGFTDVEVAVQRNVSHIRECPWLHTDLVRGFVYDVRTGRIAEIAGTT